MKQDNSFAVMVKSRRTELGMSQVALADLVGRSASAIRSWERGASTPSDENVVRSLAAVLGIPDADLRAAVGLPTEAPAGGTEVAEDGSLEAFLAEGAAELKTPEGASREEVEEPPAEPVPVTRDADGDLPDEKVPDEPGDEPETVERPDEKVPDEADDEPETFEPPDADDRPVVREQPGPPSTMPEPAVAREIPDPVRAAAKPPISPAVTSRTVTMPAGTQPAPPANRSYLDDPDQMTTYWIRTALAVALSLFLLVVLFWALGRLGESIGEIWDLFKAGT